MSNINKIVVNNETYDVEDAVARKQISELTIPSALSDLTGDASHRVVTDSEKEAWNNKSDFSGSYNDLTDKPTIENGTKIIYQTTEPTTDLKNGMVWVG